MDEDGIDPDAFAHACRTLKPKELYLNTLPSAASTRRHRPFTDRYGNRKQSA